MSLRETCASCGADVGTVETALMQLEAARLRPPLPHDAADIGGLVTYIVDHHHRYVRQALPVLESLLRKLIEAHGDDHPELRAILDCLCELGPDLLNHQAKEEHLLFPAILALANAGADGPPADSPFSTIYHPIRAMEMEHDRVHRLMSKVRALASHYVPPPDACPAWRLCLVGLEQFECDLHAHMHLESYLLFPRALDLEVARH